MRIHFATDGRVWPRIKSLYPFLREQRVLRGLTVIDEQEAAMSTIVRGSILCIAMLMLSFPAHAEEVTKEQIKGLDEQVQEIKTDVLGIASQLNALEEKLLYPSNTQVAVFVSMDGAQKFRLDSMEIQLDGKPVTHYLYSFKELEALKKGGVQRIYVGNIKSGPHDLQVLVTGKTGGGSDLHTNKSLAFKKDVGPKMVEIHLAGAETITLKEW
jgi:hypothetical protein